jgi:excisionase family DNA binding protein
MAEEHTLRSEAEDSPEVAEPADLLTVEEAARRLRIGRTTLYALISTGQIETVTIGRRRLVPPECVAAYVAALRAARQAADIAA